MNILDLPKIELHCHLDGSIRPQTIIDLSAKEGINIKDLDIKEIKTMVTAPEECQSLDEYLKRFEIPISIMQTNDSLRRVAFELFEDAANENVKYMEVRFAPMLHTEKGLSIEEIIESVLDGIKDAENKYDIKGNLILSCLRHMSSDSAIEVVEKGRKFISRGVVAIDLAGGEAEGFCEKFTEPIKLAKTYGYRVTIHAGETGIGKNVLEAIELLGAERIGHGVFIKDCIEAYEIVKKKGIVLEMCPTSNIQTKAVASLKNHPIYNFYKDGIKVTINTDNRTVSDTTMTNECKIVFDKFDITLKDYEQIYYNSVNASFADEETKEMLKNIL